MEKNKEIISKRETLKKQEYNRRLAYYNNLKKTAEDKLSKQLSDKYQKQFDRSRKRYLTRFDKKTDQLLKNEVRKEKWVKKVKYKSTRVKKIWWTTVKAAIQKYVRLRDSDNDGYWYCIVTGQRLHWKKANWWHYISASYKKTALNLDNIHFQSPSSNKIMSMWDKKADEHLTLYRQNLIKKIWYDKVILLEEEHEEWKYKIYKWNKKDLEDIYNKYTELCSILESQKKS